MIIYDLNFIYQIKDSLNLETLNTDVKKYLNNIVKDIINPVYNITPSFNTDYKYNKNKNNYKKNSDFNKKYDNKKSYKNFDNSIDNINDNKKLQNNKLDNDKICNNNLDDKLNDIKITNYNINRLIDINNKTDLEITILNIRKILNKISIKTYDKLKNEFLCYYSTINNYNNINELNIFIFESLVYTNKFFINIYSDLFKALTLLNNNFLDILNDNINVLLNICNHIKYYTNNDFNENCIINKHNDRYKCFSAFYVKCYELDLIDIDIILTVLINIQNRLLENLKIENKKVFCEELTDFLYVIIYELYTCDKNKNKNVNENVNKDEKLNIFYKNVKYIASLKPNALISLSHKIIFKNLDIIEKYQIQ